MVLFALIPAGVLDPSTWARVDDPDRPDAIARSATGSVLAVPPTDGTRWRPESLAVPDGGGEAIALGDPVSVTNADLWHADGITGAGVKVAIFDPGWFGGDADIEAVIGDYESHDCFISPTCERPFDALRPNNGGETGTHGFACAESLRRIAPDAELHLVRTDSYTMLENAVDWAIREGVDVVSMSISFYNDSFYDGTGPHDALVRALDAGGVLLVSSAGNDATLHWQGPYVDADGDGRLDGDGDNGLFLYLDHTASISLVWNQFGARCGDTDLDVVVLDPDGNEIGSSNDHQEPGEAEECKPVDFVTPIVAEPDWYRVEVPLRRGVRVGVDLSLTAKSGHFLDPVAEGSVVDPGSNALTVAVGAVRSTQYWDGPPESFSSRGPTRGGVPKPNLMGPDGLSTTVGGAVGLFGTSASTPVVAGLIALVMQDDPSLSSREAYERLAGWAHAPSPSQAFPPGTYGAGLARLPTRDPVDPGCGRRPLWMVALFLPWGRRRGAR